MTVSLSDFSRYIFSGARYLWGQFFRWRYPASRIVRSLAVMHWDGITQFVVEPERTRHCVEMGGLTVFNLTPLTMAIVAVDLRFSVNSREFGKDSRRLPMAVPLPPFERGGYMYEVDISPALVQVLRERQSDYEHLQIMGQLIISTIHGDLRVDVHKNIAAPISRGVLPTRQS